MVVINRSGDLSIFWGAGGRRSDYGPEEEQPTNPGTERANEAEKRGGGVDVLVAWDSRGVVASEEKGG